MTIREIIAAAMRRGKILASGETPSADEERDILARLQSLILEHPGLTGAVSYTHLTLPTTPYV